MADQPSNATGVTADGSEWDGVPPSLVCSKADRPQREPSMDWSRYVGSHGSVINHWTRFGTNVFLGRLSRQGDRQCYCRSLGFRWVSGAIRRSQELKKRMRLATVNSLKKDRLKTGGWRRHEFLCPLDTDRLMGDRLMGVALVVEERG